MNITKTQKAFFNSQAKQRGGLVFGDMTRKRGVSGGGATGRDWQRPVEVHITDKPWRRTRSPYTCRQRRSWHQQWRNLGRAPPGDLTIGRWRPLPLSLEPTHPDTSVTLYPTLPDARRSVTKQTNKQTNKQINKVKSVNRQPLHQTINQSLNQSVSNINFLFKSIRDLRSRLRP